MIAALTIVSGVLAVVATEAPAAATVTVTSVQGYACGYTANVGLFGGGQAQRGCPPQPGGSAGSLSPAVTLPAGGSASPITATDNDGASATYGPSVVFGGEWPASAATAPPSGPISVSTQGTPAGVNSGGAVTASADISLYPTPQTVTCATGFNPPCTVPGGFGPDPVAGDSLHVQCSATSSGVSGSTTFSHATLATSTDSGGEPVDKEAVPDNPPVNYTRSGVITNVGDIFTVVYNEQVIGSDGALTVNAAHLYLFGPTAVGDVIKGQVKCGTMPSPVSPNDQTAPTCGVRTVEQVSPTDPTPKTPRTELGGVIDAGGIQSIDHIQATNATVQVGNPGSPQPYLVFTPGQTGPAFVTAQIQNAALPMSWSFDATDTSGHVTHCAARMHPPADFNGDGKTDVSVFRPSTGQWLSSSGLSTSFGVNGDIPVPCDYNGDGTTDIAVFRGGGWYVQNQPTVFFGVSGDIPVPGDYNGDGHCDLAVFRPSVGGWYVQNQPAVFFGTSGDIPVPGDYNGDGTTDIGVFRPSVGGWYVTNQPTVFLGVNGDIPVPNDYNGNGTTDVAIFRPANGGWFILGQPTLFLGGSGDIPVPGAYHYNGDIGVFRPSSGGWFLQGQTTSFGGNGDIPLPLPAAIRLAFFP